MRLDAGLGTGLSVGWFHGSDYSPPAEIASDPRVAFDNDVARLRRCDVVVAPARKWAFDHSGRWPFGIVDEAYQMRSDHLMPVGAMNNGLLLLGDPGQLSPFTAADDTRLRGLALSPLDTAAGTVLTTHPQALQIALRISWRLPPSAAAVISDAFYEKR